MVEEAIHRDPAQESAKRHMSSILKTENSDQMKLKFHIVRFCAEAVCFARSLFCVVVSAHDPFVLRQIASGSKSWHS